MNTVSVICHLSQGVKLRLFEAKNDEFGIKSTVSTGASVTLRPGLNEGVDADFVAQWVEANRENGALLSLIEIVKENEQ